MITGLNVRRPHDDENEIPERRIFWERWRRQRSHGSANEDDAVSSLRSSRARASSRAVRSPSRAMRISRQKELSVDYFKDSLAEIQLRRG